MCILRRPPATRRQMRRRLPRRSHRGAGSWLPPSSWPRRGGCVPPDSGPQLSPRRRGRSWFRRSPGHLGRRGRPGLAPAAVLVLVLAVIAAAALGLTELNAGTAPQAGRMPSAGNSAAGSALLGGRSRYILPSRRGRRKAQAAAWVVSQVSGAAIIACDPAMCAALQAQGVVAGRLMPMRPGSDNPLGSSVVVTSSPASSQLAGGYAPAVIASFGSGGTRVDVRATEPGGAAAYQSLLWGRSRRPREPRALSCSETGVSSSPRHDAAQLRAGEVDSHGCWRRSRPCRPSTPSG